MTLPLSAVVNKCPCLCRERLIRYFAFVNGCRYVFVFLSTAVDTCLCLCQQWSICVVTSPISGQCVSVDCPPDYACHHPCGELQSLSQMIRFCLHDSSCLIKRSITYPLPPIILNGVPFRLLEHEKTERALHVHQ